jgi:predicted molibdopterin-dependent oxidoreductase YjgC
MNQRITKPYIKRDGQLVEASFEEAFQYIHQQLQASEVNGTLVMSSGSYSNETLYLIQRLARTALNTNALGSFDYYRRGTDFFADKNDLLPFAEMFLSGKFYCIFDYPDDNDGVETGHCPGVETGRAPSLQTPETLKAVLEILNRCPDTPRYWFNTPDTLTITDYYAFFRSVNYYLIQHHLEKGIYVESLGKNYGSYKQALLADDYEGLLRQNKLQDTDIQKFVEDLLAISEPAFIVWERWLTESAYHELENLCMLLDIQAKPATGFLSIKSELNSQGLYDMGLFPHVAPGGHAMNTEWRQKMEAVLGTSVCGEPIDLPATIDQAGFRNVLLWNPLNVVVPQDVMKQVDKADFAMVHTAFMPDNTDRYDVILPANLPEELSGTYTDTAKTPHNFVSDIENPLEYNNLQQIAKLVERFGYTFPNDKDAIFLEYISFMEAGCHSAERHFFR